MSSTSSSTLDTNFTKDSYIPVFDVNPSSYQEWRKRISIYHLKMKLQKRSVETVLNPIGSLQGTAWKLVESFDVTKIDEQESFDDVSFFFPPHLFTAMGLSSILDAASKYDARVRMPQDFDAHFNFSRRRGSTLLHFVTEHDEMLRKLAKHGVKFPDQMQGWILLRRANLTREQHQFVLSQVPKLEKLRVQEALFVILGPDYKPAVRQDRTQHRFPGKPFPAWKGPCCSG